MSKRLGERLVENRLITEAQLEEVLKNQLIYGGHLGTCLIEFGLIDEETLGHALEEIYEVPYAPSPLLHDVSERAIRSIPCRLVEAHQVVPFRLSERRLHVAMIDPRNVRAIDELGFVSGRRITPWISPEIRILQAMERYYGVPRRLRYISICQSIDKSVAAGSILPGGVRRLGEPVPGTAPRPAYEPSERGAARPETARGKGASGASQSPDAASRASHEGRHAAEKRPHAEGDESFDQYGYGRPWQEIAEELGRRDGPVRSRRASSSSSSSSSAGAKRRLAGRAMTIEEAARHLCFASSKQDLASAVLGFTSGRMARSALLAVQGDNVTLWDSSGLPAGGSDKARRSLSVSSESLFELMFGSECFRGPLPQDTRYLGFYRKMRIQVPREILLAPVHYNDRLVALFYGDGGVKGTIQGENEDYLKLFRMLSRAIALVIVKKRILEMATTAAELRGPERVSEPVLIDA